MQGPKETTPHVVETTSCVHETGCVTLRYALVIEGRPERSASSTDAIPHLYLKSNQLLDLCLLIWHHECLCSSFAWFEVETEKHTVLEDLSLSEGAETTVGTIHLRWACWEDVRGCASKSVRTNFCTRWSLVITHPGHLPPGRESLHPYHWLHWTRWLLGLEAFDKMKISSRYPTKNSDLKRHLEDSSNGGLLYCKPLPPQRYTKIQALGEFRCCSWRIQALRPRCALC
jgi:hypothetical protein